MSRKFCICAVVFGMFLSSACVGADAVVASRFNRLVPLQVPAKMKPILESRQIKVADIEKAQVPADWLIAWGDYPADCRFYGRDDHFGVQTAQGVLIYNTVGCRRLSRNYNLNLELTMPADAAEQSSQVTVGIIQYGLIEPGRHYLKELTVKRGESAAWKVPVQIERGVPTFQVLLKIQGNVILQALTVTELPDDLAKSGITVLEGTLAELSALPDPKKSDYPDCRFTALLEGDHIIAGVSCPQKLQLVIDGFQKYQLLETKRLKSGDKIRCFALPFEKLPEEKKSIQQADDLNLFELPSYYALGIEVVPNFSPHSVIPFSGEQQYVSVFKRQINPPLSAEVKEMQRQAIADSLARINQMLEPYSAAAELDRLNARFAEVWETEKAKDAPGFNRVAGTYVWRNIDNSFWALPEKYALVPKYYGIGKDKLEALSAFQDFLNANGCQLIIGIIPKLHAISARVINREFRDIPDFNSACLVRELLSNNLEAVYISDKLLADYHRYPFAFFYPDNDHPADTTQDILTDAFAQLLERYHFPKTLAKERFSTDLVQHAYAKDKRYHFPADCDIAPYRAGETFLCRRVLYEGKEVFPDPRSPILVLGNSFIQTPVTNSPDSFSSLLASKICMRVATSRFSGASGPMTNGINYFFANPEKTLQGKRVLLLILGARHFDNARFNNIREMDRQMTLLAGKSLAETIAVSGNTELPSRFQNLPRAQCLTIPDAGKVLVLACTSSRDEHTPTVVIPICAPAPCPAKLKVNGTAYAIPEGGAYSYNRVVVPLSKDAEHLTIELEGKPGTTIAIGDIQIFK